tara:strand:+ start:3581 stop:3844 length:264 start_codon:yes stop_codon:yes gene_type:complete
MNPIDVGYGPVQFERSFKSVPKPPTPSLAGLGSGLGYNPPKMLVNTAAIGLVGIGVAAVVMGDKSQRKRNAKMAAAFAAVAFFAISS